MFRLAAFVALLSLVSCATQPYRPYAREVKKKPGVEGIIALKTEHITEDRTYADTLMTKNCGTLPVNVLEEGEVVVGQTTTQDTQAHDERQANGFDIGGGFKMLTGGHTDMKKVNTTSSTVAVKEWQINYNCKSEVAAASGKVSKKIK